MMEKIEAYPLCWPAGRKRTPRWNQQTAKFNATFAVARDEIVHEIELLIGRWESRKAGAVVISTNLALRRDGLPLAGQRQPDDTGVAVYFAYNGRQMCFACDRWKKIEDNMQAVRKTIEALRGINRWGTGDMMEAAFTGFTALPAPAAARHWRTVLAEAGNEATITTLDQAQAAYRVLRSKHHPDNGGDAARFNEVQRAWEQAQRDLA